MDILERLIAHNRGRTFSEGKSDLCGDAQAEIARLREELAEAKENLTAHSETVTLAVNRAERAERDLQDEIALGVPLCNACNARMSARKRLALRSRVV